MQSSKKGSERTPNIRYCVRSAPPMPMFAKLKANKRKCDAKYFQHG